MSKEPLEITAFLKKVTQVLLGIAIVSLTILFLTSELFKSPFMPHSWMSAIVAILFGMCGTYLAWMTARTKRATAKEQAQKIEKAESRAEAEPEKAKFAWDVARVKLEAYFDRNLTQVNQIFYVALAVMFVGFAFIMWAVWLSIGQPKITPTSLVASSAGILSQFIGATFMLIYRSTTSQANSFMSVLERINPVGMSIQILDSIPEGDEKNHTRAQMIDVLLNTNMKFRPSAPKTVKKKAGGE
jgi:hypothetical protein